MLDNELKDYLDKLYAVNSDVMLIENKTFEQFDFVEWVYTLADIEIEEKMINEDNLLNVYNSECIYKAARFQKALKIKNCIFQKDFLFWNNTDKSIVFLKSVELSDVNISRHTNLTGTMFSNNLIISNSSFNELKMNNCCFNNILFEHCSFIEKADFSECHFQFQSSFNTFSNCSFFKRAYFDGCIFYMYVHFHSNKFIGAVSFNNIQFKSQNYLYPTKLFFSRTEIHNDFEIIPESNTQKTDNFEIMLGYFPNSINGRILIDLREVSYSGKVNQSNENHKILISGLKPLTSNELIYINGRYNNHVDIKFKECRFNSNNVILHQFNIECLKFEHEEGMLTEGLRFLHCTWPKKQYLSLITYIYLNGFLDLDLRKPMYQFLLIQKKTLVKI